MNMKQQTVWVLITAVMFGLMLELSGYERAPLFIAAFVTGYITNPMYWRVLSRWEQWRRPAQA